MSAQFPHILETDGTSESTAQTNILEPFEYLYPHEGKTASLEDLERTTLFVALIAAFDLYWNAQDIHNDSKHYTAQFDSNATHIEVPIHSNQSLSLPATLIKRKVAPAVVQTPSYQSDDSILTRMLEMRATTKSQVIKLTVNSEWHIILVQDPKTNSRKMFIPLYDLEEKIPVYLQIELNRHLTQEALNIGTIVPDFSPDEPQPNATQLIQDLSTNSSDVAYCIYQYSFRADGKGVRVDFLKMVYKQTQPLLNQTRYDVYFTAPDNTHNTREGLEWIKQLTRFLTAGAEKRT